MFANDVAVKAWVTVFPHYAFKATPHDSDVQRCLNFLARQGKTVEDRCRRFRAIYHNLSIKKHVSAKSTSDRRLSQSDL